MKCGFCFFAPNMRRFGHERNPVTVCAGIQLFRFREKTELCPGGGISMEDNVRVIDRTLDILEVLSSSEGPVSLAEICSSTGISKSTVFRLLATLCARKYVEKRPDGTYSIGYKLMELVSLHINQIDILTEAKPYLNDLSRSLGLTTHLGIIDGHDIVYIEKTDTMKNSREYTQVGFRSPAVCSSMGKCLLACLSGEELDNALYGYKFEKYTPNTITDVAEFRRYLKVVRRQGWAMDNEEYRLGHRCIGAPIFDYHGCCVAAISASGSTAQLPDERLETVIKEVRKAAAELSKRLGFAEE